MIPENYSYFRPLPIGLYIGDSLIDGQGLKTRVKIDKDTELGITHAKTSSALIRTPLGGFINDSDNPNCIITDMGRLDKDFYYLVTLRDIEPWEELTCDYSKSSCGKDTCEKKKQAFNI